MENQISIILSKESTSEQLKSYFTKISELSQSDNQFPISFDEVWPLVYSSRKKAIEKLKQNYIESEDFIIKPQVGLNSKVGKPQQDYYLSLSCLEYFIVRKVRPVFEVYRTVFHKTANMLTQQQASAPLSRKDLAMMVIQAEEEKERLMLENKTQAEQIKHDAPKVDYYDEVLKSETLMTTSLVANHIGMSAIKLNNMLVSIGVQGKGKEGYRLLHPYYNWNLGGFHTYTYEDKETGMTKSSHTLKWNERGLRFITALTKCDWNTKKAIKSINGQD